MTLVDLLWRFWGTMGVHLYQTTLVLIPLVLIAAGLRRAPARVTHTLWRLSLLKFLMPLSLAGSVVAGLAARLGIQLPAGGEFTSLPTLQLIVEAFGSPVQLTGLPVGHSWASYAIIAMTLGYAVGMVWIAARALRHLTGTGALGGCTLRHLPDASDLAVLRTGADALGISRDRIVVTERAVMPATVGVLSPKIVIPRQLLRTLGPRETQVVLLHENGHLCRRDPLWLLVQHLVLSVFFIYPPLWLILRRLRESSEFACDELVRRRGVSVVAYGRALVSALRLGLAQPMEPVAALGSGASMIRRRLARMEQMTRYTAHPGEYLLVACAALMISAGSLMPTPRSVRGESHTSTTGGLEETVPYTTAPEVLEMTSPTYPPAARAQKLEGTVVLRVRISADGEVAAAEVVQRTGGHPDMEGEALEAVRTWRFRPALLEDAPVAVWVMIPVQFRMN